MPLIEVLGVPRMWRWRRRKFKTAIREAVAKIHAKRDIRSHF